MLPRGVVKVYSEFVALNWISCTGVYDSRCRDGCSRNRRSSILVQSRYGHNAPAGPDIAPTL